MADIHSKKRRYRRFFSLPLCIFAAGQVSSRVPTGTQSLIDGELKTLNLEVHHESHFKYLVCLISPGEQLLLIPTASANDSYSSAIATFKQASETHKFFDSAYGYAIFPTVGKGGLGIGAAYGKGRVYRGGVYTGESSMTQVSIGFQIGGQAYSEIIFFKDEQAYRDFTSGSFEFGAQLPP